MSFLGLFEARAIARTHIPKALRKGKSVEELRTMRKEQYAINQALPTRPTKMKWFASQHIGPKWLETKKKAEGGK